MIPKLVFFLNEVWNAAEETETRVKLASKIKATMKIDFFI